MYVGINFSRLFNNDYFVERFLWVIVMSTPTNFLNLKYI